MNKQNKCKKSMISVGVGCVGMAVSQDPYSVISCVWSIVDVSFTCAGNKQVIKRRPFQFNFEKNFTNFNQRNRIQRIYFKRRSNKKERELKKIVDKLNRDSVAQRNNGKQKSV